MKTNQRWIEECVFGIVDNKKLSIYKYIKKDEFIQRYLNLFKKKMLL